MTTVWELINLLLLIFFVVVLPVGCVLIFRYIKQMHDRVAEMDVTLKRIAEKLGK